MKNTIVVNLYGAPGAGKSTTMAAIFAKLKDLGIDCEMAPEFVKELVWEKRNATVTDQIYIFAKQNHRIHRLYGQVDVIITDAPIALSLYYGKDDSELCNLVKKTSNSYNNLNVYISRVKDYNPNGRFQTEAESDKLGLGLIEILDINKIDYIKTNGDSAGKDLIINEILRQIGK